MRYTSEPILNAHAQAPLAVAPREACRLLSIGESTLYALHAGELNSFRIGAARRITVKSTEEYMRRQLAAPDAAIALAVGTASTATEAAIAT